MKMVLFRTRRAHCRAPATLKVDQGLDDLMEAVALMTLRCPLLTRKVQMAIFSLKEEVISLNFSTKMSVRRPTAQTLDNVALATSPAYPRTSNKTVLCYTKEDTCLKLPIVSL